MISNIELTYYARELINWGFELEVIHTDLVLAVNSNVNQLNHRLFLVNDIDEHRIHINLNSFDPGGIIISKIIDEETEYGLINIPLVRNEDYNLFITLFDKFIELAYEFINNSKNPFDIGDFTFIYNKLVKESIERQNKVEQIN